MNIITKKQGAKNGAGLAKHEAFIAALCGGKQATQSDGISCYIVDVTPTIAKKLLELNFDRNRAVRKNNLQGFVRRLEIDEFFEGSVIRLVYADGAFTLTDGQHRLEAIALSDCAATMTIVILDGEPSMDYALLDGEGARRSTPDVMSALDEAGEFEHLNSSLKYTFNAATRIIHSNFKFEHTSNLRLTAAEIMARGREFKTELSTFISYVGMNRGGRSAGVWRAPILAVALVTIKYADPSLTKPFWTQVVSDDGLRVGDPRKRLNYWLQDTSGNGPGPVKQSQNAAAAAICWNYYTEQKPLTKLYSSNAIPKIALTPYPLAKSTE